MGKDSFGARTALNVGGRKYTIFSLPALEKRGFALARLPYSIKVMLENVLRREDGVVVTADQVEAVATLAARRRGEREFSFMPARVLLQDFTGVPVVADLAAMRDAIKRLGGDPAQDQSAAARRSRDRPFGAGRFASGRQRRSRSTPSWSSSAIASATSSCAGARAPSITSAWSRPTPESCIR